MDEIVREIEAGRGVSAERAEALAVALGEGRLAGDEAGRVLEALRRRGETAAEVAGFVRGMRRLARPAPGIDGAGAIDIVGTGGDGAHTVNLSTGAALLAAACGLRVVKHGNRSISSRCGSADVLEALGMKLDLDDQQAAGALARHGLVFLFAPRYHPAFARVGPVRRALGGRTIFNMLGPLLNPARPGLGLIGAYSASAAGLMAGALSELEPGGRFMVVHGLNGWDEPTPCGAFEAWRVGWRGAGSVERVTIDPAGAGVARCEEAALRGGDAAENARIIRGALTDRPGPVREALVLGAGLALHIAGRAGTLGEGVLMARGVVERGGAGAWLSAVTEGGGA
jgi:anthranilate phosphoribosyltransferase